MGGMVVSLKSGSLLMANDKFHQRNKLTRRALKRKKATKSELKRVLIICEDSDSSPSYFRQLIAHFGLTTAEVKICGEECGSAPSNVAKYGGKYLKETDNNFDYVFFVFDRDTHETYNNALAKIEGLSKKRTYKNKISIQAITSYPCFEVWLKLHFDDSSKPYSAGKKSPANLLIDDIKKIEAFKDYSKDSKCTYFDDIKGHINTAIENAKILLKNGTDAGSDKHDINPSTLIHELVVILRDEIKT